MHSDLFPSAAQGRVKQEDRAKRDRAVETRDGFGNRRVVGRERQLVARPAVDSPAVLAVFPIRNIGDTLRQGVELSASGVVNAFQ